MNNQNKLDELNMDMQTYKKVSGTLSPQEKKEVTITSDKPTSSTSVSTVMEDDSVIEPKDAATIKYLSNVKDANTGEISKPFTIADKRYQMIRGIDPEQQVVMAVYCYDDINENGENLIHPVDYFEETIAKPMKEQMGMVGQDIHVGSNEEEEDTYEGFKHYLVNRKTNEVRKYKTIEEVISSNKTDDEEYMSASGFKRYMNEKLFGVSKRRTETLTEVMPTGEENDEEMNLKAKKLMDLISKRIPKNVITTIKTPVARREVIAAFAELIGVPRNGLSNLISGLKDLATSGKEDAITENKVFSKKQLEETIKAPKVIKTIKIKDIK